MTFEPRVGDLVRSTKDFGDGNKLIWEYKVTTLEPPYFNPMELGALGSKTEWVNELIKRGFIDEPQGIGAIVTVPTQDGRTFVFVRTVSSVPWTPILVQLSSGKIVKPTQQCYSWDDLESIATDIEVGVQIGE